MTASTKQFIGKLVTSLIPLANAVATFAAVYGHDGLHDALEVLIPAGIGVLTAVGVHATAPGNSDDSGK